LLKIKELRHIKHPTWLNFRGHTTACAFRKNICAFRPMLIFTDPKSQTMKNRSSLYLHLIFALIALVELTGRWMDHIQLEYLVKPLIMVWITLYFLRYKRKKSFSVPVLLAFFFSWLGDNFLMFSGKVKRSSLPGWEVSSLPSLPIYILFPGTVRKEGRATWSVGPGWY
jgi:hypothetical protein